MFRTHDTAKVRPIRTAAPRPVAQVTPRRLFTIETANPHATVVLCDYYGARGLAIAYDNTVLAFAPLSPAQMRELADGAADVSTAATFAGEWLPVVPGAVVVFLGEHESEHEPC